MKIKFTVIAIAGLAVAGQAIVIDDYSSGAVSGSQMTGMTISYQTGSMLGGTRAVASQVTSNTYGFNYSTTITGVAGGVMGLASGPGVDGATTLNYGYSFASGNYVDLNSNFSASSTFLTTFLSNDVAGTLTIGVRSSQQFGNAFQYVTKSIPIGVASTNVVVVNFSDFVGYNFSDVDQVSFKVDPGVSGDVVVSRFETSAVPEPATMFALALGGVAILSRKRKS